MSFSNSTINIVMAAKGVIAAVLALKQYVVTGDDNAALQFQPGRKQNGNVAWKNVALALADKYKMTTDELDKFAENYRGAEFVKDEGNFIRDPQTNSVLLNVSMLKDILALAEKLEKINK